MSAARKKERLPYALHDPARVKRWFIFDAGFDGSSGGFLIERIIRPGDVIYYVAPSSLRFTQENRAALIADVRRVRMERAEHMHGVGRG